MRYFLSLLISFATITRIFAANEPASIPVVKTWEELQKVPAIELGDGVEIHLGLESDKISQWSGALLYCLAENYDPTKHVIDPDIFGSSYDYVGPVHVDFSLSRKNVKEVRENLEVHNQSGKGTYLCARVLPIDHVGTYSITVSNSQGKMLVKANVEGTKDFYHPWTTWNSYWKKEKSPLEKGIVMPQLRSLGKIGLFVPNNPPKGSLPIFLPSDDKPQLNIKQDENKIVVSSDSKFTISHIRDHFMARWWVNEKPFVPEQLKEFPGWQSSGLVNVDTMVKLDFDFKPEHLGAKPGDKIGLQLMHSEGGWVWHTHAHTSHSIMADPKLAGFDRAIKVSNRIEFEVPKE